MNVSLIAIIPEGSHWWDDPFVSQKLTSALDGVANTARGLLKGTTSDWDDPVDFEISGSGDERVIGTDDLKFLWVDQGTRGHAIGARSGKMLRMETGYRAKTGRGNLARRGGGSSGDAGYVFRRAVYHPGIQARHLVERVEGLTQPLLESRVNAVLEKFAGGG